MKKFMKISSVINANSLSLSVDTAKRFSISIHDFYHSFSYKE
jgi:hypothetical protein